MDKLLKDVKSLGLARKTLYYGNDLLFVINQLSKNVTGPAPRAVGFGAISTAPTPGDSLL